ncbi:DUF4870 domain-containing protein [Flavitalea sp.]|nr:helix-turn-helix domain-containing protein [Flavitalea sp.]
MDIANRIRELRLKKGLTQEELAEKTGMSTRTIQRIEQGKVSPRSYSLQNLAIVLDVAFEELNDKLTQSEQNKTGNEQNWLSLLHISGIFLLLIPPVIIWACKKGAITEMRQQGIDVINFQLSMLVILIPAGLLAFTMVTLPICIFIGVYSTIVIVYNSILVLNDQSYRYPITFKFLKN